MCIRDSFTIERGPLDNGLEYLRTIAYDGRAVVRSGQTLSHYRELLAASERPSTHFIAYDGTPSRSRPRS